MFFRNVFFLHILNYFRQSHALNCQVGYQIAVGILFNQETFTSMQCPSTSEQNCISVSGNFQVTFNSIPLTGRKKNSSPNSNYFSSAFLVWPTFRTDNEICCTNKRITVVISFLNKNLFMLN